MHSEETSVEDYLDQLPPDRSLAISTIRAEILANLDDGFAEAMSWGMICYEVPLETFPDTSNGKPLMFAALASQKNHMAVYLTTIYGDEAQKTWFEAEYKATGKKLDMGKSCVRFKKLEDLPVALIGEVIGQTTAENFIEAHGRR